MKPILLLTNPVECKGCHQIVQFMVAEPDGTFRCAAQCHPGGVEGLEAVDISKPEAVHRGSASGKGVAR